MMLEVSLDTLNRSKITAHQFLIAKLIMDKQFDELEKYLNNTNCKDVASDLENLHKLGYISVYEYNDFKDLKNIRIMSSFLKEISGDNFFDELYNSFPVKVVRDGGITDYLRTDRYNSRKLYDMLVSKNRSKHEHILKCLKAEIDHRERTGSIRYIKRLYNWILSREWRSFEERVADSENVQLDNIMIYGTELE
jgi:flagellin-specific chaperone FliS